MPADPTDLRKQLGRLMAEKDSLTDKKRNFDQRLTAIASEVEAINKALSTTEPAPPTVSDHALVRYIERKYNLDLELMKAEVMPLDRNLLNSIKALGDGKYPVGDSHRIVVKGNTITTVLPLVDDRK